MTLADRAIAYVLHHPGCSLVDVIRATHRTVTGRAYERLYRLERAGRLRVERSTRPARCYVDVVAPKTPRRGLSPREVRIRDWVRANPGRTISEVGAGACPELVQSKRYRAVHQLAARGVLVLRPHPMKRGWREVHLVARPGTSGRLPR